MLDQRTTPGFLVLSMGLRVAIIGSGFGGLCMAIALKNAGASSFVVFEKSDRLGGTWRDNTYPGAACDIMSHLYSYSFEPKHDWSRVYAEQPEILAYLDRCATKYGIWPHVRLGTEVTQAVFDETRRTWNLLCGDGSQWEVDVVIAATGQLNRPALPHIDGLERFRGAAFHSARWDPRQDLRDARVGVVGTGASAIQFVPQIAAVAKHVAVFQRTPVWVLPKLDRRYGRADRWVSSRIPAVQRASRLAQYLWGEGRLLAFDQESHYNALVRWVATRHMERSIRDPRLRAALTPDYPPGCKRLLISNDWFDALAKPHVALITTPILRATEEGLQTEDGAVHPLDVLVFGTGFETTRFLAPMRVVGRGARELDDVWRQGAEALLGMTISGFPNLFLLYGPNTNLAHNSIVFMLEAQARYVSRCLTMLEAKGARTMEPTARAATRFSEEMARRFRGSIWEAGCTSWYRTEAGRHTNNWPGFTLEYAWRTRRPRAADYVFSD